MYRKLIFLFLILYGTHAPKGEGEGLALVIPKGDFMKPMKKPIRLFGMVFQIDK
jgi:hypothetical protein